jgi:Transposase zinc-binding domain
VPRFARRWITFCVQMIDFQSIFQDKSITQFNDFSQSVFDKLARCHTAKMGVHRLRCNEQTCGKEQYQFHNCGNRNCPNCGGLKKEEWIDNRMQELLPTPYYHLVFTLPHQLNPLILGNRKLLFKLLFDAAW